MKEGNIHRDLSDPLALAVPVIGGTVLKPISCVVQAFIDYTEDVSTTRWGVSDGASICE